MPLPNPFSITAIKNGQHENETDDIQQAIRNDVSIKQAFRLTDHSNHRTFPWKTRLGFPQWHLAAFVPDHGNGWYARAFNPLSF